MLISRESIQALMPHQSLTKIIGEPTHAAMKKLEKECDANLIAVACPWGVGQGYLGDLLPAAIFQARYGAPYTPPAAAPPAYPVIPPGATTAIREELRATNEEAQQHWQTMLHVCRIAINLSAAAIKPVYYAELDDPDEGLNDVVVQTSHPVQQCRTFQCTIPQEIGGRSSVRQIQILLQFLLPPRICLQRAPSSRRNAPPRKHLGTFRQPLEIPTPTMQSGLLHS